MLRSSDSIQCPGTRATEFAKPSAHTSKLLFSASANTLGIAPPITTTSIGFNGFIRSIFFCCGQSFYSVAVSRVTKKGNLYIIIPGMDVLPDDFIREVMNVQWKEVLLARPD